MFVLSLILKLIIILNALNIYFLGCLLLLRRFKNVYIHYIQNAVLYIYREREGESAVNFAKKLSFFSVGLGWSRQINSLKST